MFAKSKTVFIRSLLYVLFSIAIFNSSALAAIQTSAEQIKAGYVYRFTQFVEWPKKPEVESRIAHDDSNFMLCVFDDISFYNILSPLKEYKVGHKNIFLTNTTSVNEITDCNVLYVSEIHSNKINSILKSVGNKPILTIGSAPDFARTGGIIGFVAINNKIKFEINSEIVKRSNLKLSAKLYETALKIYKNEQRGVID